MRKTAPASQPPSQVAADGFFRRVAAQSIADVFDPALRNVSLVIGDGVIPWI
ncbi:MAG: hypothetical protein AB7U20_18740 [Planctomycetaceae bacterium]